MNENALIQTLVRIYTIHEYSRHDTSRFSIAREKDQRRNQGARLSRHRREVRRQFAILTLEVRERACDDIERKQNPLVSLLPSPTATLTAIGQDHSHGASLRSCGVSLRVNRDLVEEDDKAQLHRAAREPMTHVSAM